MARFSVDDVGITGRKRKKMSGAAEETQSKTRDLTAANHSQNQDGMVESEERVVDEEQEEEESEEGGDFGSSNGGGQTFVSIDTDVLDCSICCEAFRPPIYQCQNGHVVCSPCCISLTGKSLFGKCPFCSQPIGLIRCLALERIIESVQIHCIKQVVKEVENEEEQEEESDRKEEENFGTSNGSQTVIRIDTDVFYCSNCCEAFRPPIYQCKNGHVVCSPCCISLFGKCPFCSWPIGLIRCLALERIIESVQIRCRNARYGCNATFSYLHQATHLEICNYRQCTCPISSCAFEGSSRSLSHHFQRHHRNSVVKFGYGYGYYVELNRIEDPFRVLLGRDGRLFLLLNNIDTTKGNTFSLICMSSRNEESNYEYELRVREKTSTLKLKTTVKSTTEWNGVYPSDFCLFVPKGFCSSPNKIFVGFFVKECNPH